MDIVKTTTYECPNLRSIEMYGYWAADSGIVQIFFQRLCSGLVRDLTLSLTGVMFDFIPGPLQGSFLYVPHTDLDPSRSKRYQRRFAPIPDLEAVPVEKKEESGNVDSTDAVGKPTGESEVCVSYSTVCLPVWEKEVNKEFA